MDELAETARDGRVIEAFACGTAYFVVPVAQINYRDEDIDIPMAKGNSGEYTAQIKQWLVDIMYGNVEHEWGVVIDEVGA